MDCEGGEGDCRDVHAHTHTHTYTHIHTYIYIYVDTYYVGRTTIRDPRLRVRIKPEMTHFRMNV